MNSWMKRYTVRCLRGVQAQEFLSSRSWGTSPSQDVNVFNHLEALWILYLGIFFFWEGTSSFGHDQPSSPFSVLLPSQENGVGAKTFKPPSWFDLLLTSPHPEAMQKPTQTHLMRTKRHTYHVGNDKGFRSSVPGTGGRDQYRVYYLIEAYWKWIPCVPKPDLLGQEEPHIFITSALANEAEIRSYHDLHWCYSFQLRTLHTAQVP